MIPKNCSPPPAKGHADYEAYQSTLTRYLAREDKDAIEALPQKYAVGKISDLPAGIWTFVKNFFSTCFQLVGCLFTIPAAMLLLSLNTLTGRCFTWLDEATNARWLHTPALSLLFSFLISPIRPSLLSQSLFQYERASEKGVIIPIGTEPKTEYYTNFSTDCVTGRLVPRPPEGFFAPLTAFLYKTLTDPIETGEAELQRLGQSTSPLTLKGAAFHLKARGLYLLLLIGVIFTRVIETTAGIFGAAVSIIMCILAIFIRSTSFQVATDRCLRFTLKHLTIIFLPGYMIYTIGLIINPTGWRLL